MKNKFMRGFPTLAFALLFASSAQAELPNPLKIIHKGSVPVIDIRGLDQDYNFQILGADTDEIYGTDRASVGVYDLSGKLKRTLTSGRVATWIRGIKTMKKVGNRYYALVNNGWMIETEGDVWKYSNRQNENYNHISDYGFDRNGNTYSLRLYSREPEILVKAPGDRKYRSIPEFYQINAKKDRKIKFKPFLVTKDGAIIARGGKGKHKQALVFSDRDIVKNLDIGQNWIVGLSPNDKILLSHKYIKNLSVMDLDGNINNLNLIEDKTIKENLSSPELSEPDDLSLSQANGLLCFDVGFEREVFCGYLPNLKMELIDEDESNIRAIGGAVVYEPK